jgi:hypothetical protein
VGVNVYYNRITDSSTDPGCENVTVVLGKEDMWKFGYSFTTREKYKNAEHGFANDDDAPQ